MIFRSRAFALGAIPARQMESRHRRTQRSGMPRASARSSITMEELSVARISARLCPHRSLNFPKKGVAIAMATLLEATM